MLHIDEAAKAERSRDEARRIAVNIARLRGLLRGKPAGCLDESGPHARETKIAAFSFQH